MIDAPDAYKRFPFQCVSETKQELRHFECGKGRFQRNLGKWLLCGTDLNGSSCSQLVAGQGVYEADPMYADR
jgi:hypothetical protein